MAFVVYCVPNQYVNMNMLVVDNAPHMLGLAAGNRGGGPSQVRGAGGRGVSLLTDEDKLVEMVPSIFFRVHARLQVWPR